MGRHITGLIRETGRNIFEMGACGLKLEQWGVCARSYRTDIAAVVWSKHLGVVLLLSKAL